ncbi:5-(carboxyamino)imidazole ribonucleotide mutase [bacterium]|nr:5-(carboxyamino)imidazole ribonucleotide mutase [bacterium]NIN92783.1 5-(carboxyamino)imidazole ribonucleotide mutase [bacterium]NIO18764.1 5-(carboxyamino)imidazole ribonucleotide mutase [bacterium]NIO73840.1 5-(carboxyamino)imidazole ribonucleotide mutase [bacterium]
MKKAVVGIVLGSDSDLSTMKESTKMLETFKVPYEMTISSAHRSPKRTLDYAKRAEKRGLKVLIVGAGGAAHLAGVIAAHTTLPVIGVPMHTGPLKGRDSLYSTVQMPKGVPVATMAIGKSGAINASIMAVEILALSNAHIRKELKKYKADLAKDVEKKSKRLERLGYQKYSTS